MSVYIELCHGRTDPDQDMEDWGSDGPILGPCASIHSVYKSHIELQELVSGPFGLTFKDDTVYYDGVYYGDIYIFDEAYFTKNKELQERHQEYDKGKATIPK